MNNFEDNIANSLHNSVEEFYPSDTIKRNVFNRLEKRRCVWFFRHKLIAIVVILVLILTVPVAAEVISNFDWHGMKVYILNSEDKVFDTPKEVEELYLSKLDEDEKAWHKKVEEGKVSSIVQEEHYKSLSVKNAIQTYTDDEAVKDFTYSIVRPINSPLSLIEAVGVKNNGQLSRFIFWDVFKNDDQQVYVMQSLDWINTKYIKTKDKKYENTHNYPSVFKKIDINENAFGFIRDDNNSEKTMYVTLINSKNEVISLYLVGNVSEEIMVGIAKSYIN